MAVTRPLLSSSGADGVLLLMNLSIGSSDGMDFDVRFFVGG